MPAQRHRLREQIWGTLARKGTRAKCSRLLVRCVLARGRTWVGGAGSERCRKANSEAGERERAGGHGLGGAATTAGAPHPLAVTVAQLREHPLAQGAQQAHLHARLARRENGGDIEAG